MNQWYSSDGKNLILLHNIELFLCPPDYGALIGSKGDSRKSWLISITSTNPVVIPTARCCQRWYCTSVCSGDVQRNDRLGFVVAQRSSGVSMILNNCRLCLSGTHTHAPWTSQPEHTHTHIWEWSLWGETLHFSPLVSANGFQHSGSSQQRRHTLTHPCTHRNNYTLQNHEQLIRPLTPRASSWNSIWTSIKTLSVIRRKYSDLSDAQTLN